MLPSANCRLSERMSISVAPSCIAACACAGVSRCRRARAVASNSFTGTGSSVMVEECAASTASQTGKNSAMCLWLARHGATDENAAGRILGRRDPPLSAVGVAQAEALADRMRGVGLARVWTSPLRRALRTAEVVAGAAGLEPVVLEDLAESDRGDWEGRLVADLARQQPELHAAFLAGEPTFRFPGGESLAEQRARTRSALAAVTAGPLPALVVAHAGTIRAAGGLRRACAPGVRARARRGAGVTPSAAGGRPGPPSSGLGISTATAARTPASAGSGDPDAATGA